MMCLLSNEVWFSQPIKSGGDMGASVSTHHNSMRGSRATGKDLLQVQLQVCSLHKVTNLTSVTSPWAIYHHTSLTSFNMGYLSSYLIEFNMDYLTSYIIEFNMGYISSCIIDFIQHGLCIMIHHWIQHGLSIIIPHSIQYGLLSHINILTEINKGYYCTWTISLYMNCLTVHELSHCTWTVSLHMNCLSEMASGHHHAALLSKVNKQPPANLESLEKSNKSQFLHASTHFHVIPQKHGKMQAPCTCWWELCSWWLQGSAAQWPRSTHWRQSLPPFPSVWGTSPVSREPAAAPTKHSYRIKTKLSYSCTMLWMG